MLPTTRLAGDRASGGRVRPEPRRPVGERLYDLLKDQILAGEHLPGTHLVEADLTREHGVSRATVREALRRLLVDDLVELLAHRGVRVRSLSPGDVVELYTVREPVEGLAARLAALAGPEPQRRLVEVHEQAGRAAAAGDRLRFARLNARLHRAVAEATGNRSLVAVLGRLNMPMVGYQFLSVGDAIDPERAHGEHGEVLTAILARDPDAAEAAMRRHLATTRDSIVRAAAAGARPPLR